MYCKFYKNENDAKWAMRQHNKSLTRKVFHKYFRVVVQGPENNYAVVDFKTASELGMGYCFG